jgi:hypothetical protein
MIFLVIPSAFKIVLCSVTWRRVVRNSTYISEKRTQSSGCSQSAACHILRTIKWRLYVLRKPRKTNITHGVTTQATALFSYHCENLKSDKYVQDLCYNTRCCTWCWYCLPSKWYRALTFTCCQLCPHNFFLQCPFIYMLLFQGSETITLY